MRFHTVHSPAVNLVYQQKNAASLLHQLDDIVAIKEGFCWPAFLFSLVWAIFFRLWRFAFYLIMINSTILLLAFQLGANHFAIFFVLLGIYIVFGYIANDARRSNLRQKGYFEKIVLVAPTKEAAIHRYLDTCVARR